MLSSWYSQQNKVQQIEIYLRPRRICWNSNVAILALLLAGLITQIVAVPMENTNSGLNKNTLILRQVESTNDDRLILTEVKEVNKTDDTFNNSPGQCLLNGVAVTEANVLCKEQVGCRAIQKTGHCCPDYQCDCEKDGKTYLNGDKLVDPDTPCTVCYCQGGEILCSSVTCFHRDDCTPTYIPGRCCPEYNNCPVINTDSTTSTIETVPEMESSSIKPEIVAAAINPKITIKEITKPTEIRITNDNKNNPINRITKPETIEAATVPTPPTTTTTQTTTTTTTVNSIEINSEHVDNDFHIDIEKSQELNNNEYQHKVFNRESQGTAIYSSIAPEVIYTNTDQNEPTTNLHQTSVDLEPDTSGSDNIYHIILTTDGPRFSSTEGYLEIEDEKPQQVVEESSQSENKTASLLEANVKDEGGTASSTEPKTSNQNFSEVVTTTEAVQEPPIDTNHTASSGYVDEEETPLPMDTNPAYPSLPEDDFSLRDVNFPLSETDDAGEVDLKDQPRSITGAYDINKTEKFSSDDSNGNATDDVNDEAVKDFPKDETFDETAKSAAQVSQSTTTSAETESLEASLESKELDDESMVNSTLKVSKEREPTTPTPSKQFDIDGTHDEKSESADDPKLDVESLKIDEDQDNSNTDTVSTGNNLSVKSSLTQQ